ncbi:MAG: hypothetical protein LH468_10775 [Nocardioides sp.]|nr:hypothetical protein [Nocardioides sp.]
MGPGGSRSLTASEEPPGLDAYASILTRPCSLEEALGEVRESLVSSAEQTMRLLLVGRRLAWQESEPRRST